MFRTSKFFFVALTFLFLGLSATTARADNIAVYTDRAAFNAASTNLTNIGFEGMVAPGQFIPIPTPPGLTLLGVNFSGVMGNLIVAGPNVYLPTSTLASNGTTDIIITFPGGITAVGMDFNLAGGFEPRIINFTTSTSETFSMISRGTLPFTVQFFGVTSSAPITSIRITSNNPTSTLVLDNVSFGQSAIPEPTTILLLSSGLAGVAMKVRRKRKGS